MSFARALCVVVVGLGVASASPLASAKVDDWPRLAWPDFAVQRQLETTRYEDATGEERLAWETGAYHSILRDTFIFFAALDRVILLEREVIAYHNEHGLELRGDLSVSFVPEEEELFLLTLRRKGPKDSDFVDLKFSVSLEHAGKVDGMYVDERTVAFIPDGVEPGDVVDFVYVIIRRIDRSFGPWDYLEINNYGAHVSSRRIEVSALSSMALRQIARGLAQAKVRQAGGRTRFVFEAEHLDSPVPAPRLPRSFEPYSALLLTEAASWEDVCGPYETLLEHLPIGDDVARLARDTVAGFPGDPVLSLAQLVRRQIRYVALEVSGHKLIPQQPSATLARGWGDCKDMSLLLVQLLRSVDIEAYPALARTADLGPVDPNMPSIAAFNHEIVAVRQKGEWLFVDPTLKEATPPWAGAVWPGERLLIIGGGNGLVEAGPQPDGLDSVEVDSKGRFEDNGGGRLRFEVESATTYRGPAASSMRRRIKEEGEEAVRSEAEAFFATAVSGMALVELHEEISSAAMNAQPLVIRERLAFAGKRSERDPRYFPPELEQVLALPPLAGRTMPVGLEHPRQVVVRLLLLGAASPKQTLPENLRYEDAFLQITRLSQRVDGGVRHTWTVRTKKEEVPVGELRALAMEVASLLANLAIPLLPQRAEGKGVGSPNESVAAGFVACLMLVGLGMGALLAALMARWTRRCSGRRKKPGEE
ncbi:MAG: DUF3857 domain-containing transglutaminase family protein [Myxococcota bacterium]|nr:DUF3857 domain-containing transglutaminase family protein [Myxococcota bacterium]